MRELGPTLTDALLEPILDRDPAGPRITYYDDATGARVELSALTLANWAAKTANLLRDEFALTPGARVVVLLRAHWQTAAVLLGAWWAGVEVVLEADPDAELAFVTADRIDDVDGVPEVVALSLDPMGGSVHDLPVGVTDYASAVRVHGDQFAARNAGLALAGMGVSEVLAAARASAEAQGVSASDRVLSTGEWDTASALVDRWLAVLVVGASLVQVVNADPARRDHVVQSERVTVQLRSGAQ
ncbi:TIGR03089 family protein [Skermania sp. ID1734]|uniref:TIGR03089 family protein n=1 Tax=Skermania sp. ID1734 TaxID=2597516 RepID=UPI00117ECDEF|nr:TIGR03089 family protein [Skermania sp. ID1734]TSD97366.1 TIGR03089 family protein [Skermania sp. ID1734]